jgi:hypothetical protein
MDRKKWKGLIIFLFVVITGLVCFALFLCDKTDARTGIIGVFLIMLAFWCSLFTDEIDMKKRMNKIEKEIKELKKK